MIGDFFGKPASELRSKKLFLLDMDGTIYQENRLFEGTKDFLQQIVQNGGKYLFVTNNSSKSTKDYVEKLTAMDIPASDESFFSSTHAAIQLLKDKFPGKTVYCQGTESFIKELNEAGIKTVTDVTDAAEVILIGFDNELTSKKLRNTCEMLLRDIPFYATNPDLTCPVSFGFVPDCGSICQMLENATGRKPIYIGKPKPDMVNLACQKLGIDKNDAVIIGDRLYTDIAAGVNAGITSICVLSGEVNLKNIEESSITPSYVFKSVKEIFEAIR